MQNYPKKHNSKICWDKYSLDFTLRPAVMGVLNVTPDSFSDGGDFDTFDKAFLHGIQMYNEGADIIDIGAESTRPGSKQISQDEQIDRSVEIIKALSRQIPIPISIDTYRAKVAQAALDAGASIINDISGGYDQDMFKLAANRNVPIILMHIKGSPDNMHKDPTYSNVVEQVLEFLLSKAQAALEAGIEKDKIILDPGIGFGKTTEHNLKLIANLKRFVNTGFTILLGASRKRFLGEITGQTDPKNRESATVATTIAAFNAGVQIVRVHDVKQNIDALKVAQQINRYAKDCSIE